MRIYPDSITKKYIKMIENISKRPQWRVPIAMINDEKDKRIADLERNREVIQERLNVQWEKNADLEKQLAEAQAEVVKYKDMWEVGELNRQSHANRYADLEHENTTLRAEVERLKKLFEDVSNLIGFKQGMEEAAKIIDSIGVQSHPRAIYAPDFAQAIRAKIGEE